MSDKGYHSILQSLDFDPSGIKTDTYRARKGTLASSALSPPLPTIQTGILFFVPFDEFIDAQTLTTSPSVCKLSYSGVLITKMIILHFQPSNLFRSLSLSIPPTA